MAQNGRNPWTILSRSTLYENRWLALVEHQVRDTSGQESAYATVKFKQIGLRILPVDREGCTYLVGQYRFAAGHYSWELPAGGGEAGEEPGEAARRELREETGLAAEHLLPVLDLTPAGSTTDHRELNYIAWGFDRVDRESDPQEVIQIRRVPFPEAVGMALSGEIRNGGSVALILAAYLKAGRWELPADLQERLRG